MIATAMIVLKLWLIAFGILGLFTLSLLLVKAIDDC
jgi:hypothetical protein